MKKQCVSLAAVILALSMSAFSAKAQGPAGVGGDQSPRSSGDSSNSGDSHSSRSGLGSWIMRKDKNGADDKSATSKADSAQATKAENSQAHHSLNPIKWIKKDKKEGNDQPTTPKVNTVKAANTESTNAKAQTMNTTKAESSHTHHSLNPVKWFKKAPEQSTQKADKAKDNKSSAPETPTAAAATPGA